MSEPGLGAMEPPPGTAEQAGLRIMSFVGIKVVKEFGFGAKEPPPGTPDQAELRRRGLELRVCRNRSCVGTRFWCKGAAARYPRSGGA